MAILLSRQFGKLVSALLGGLLLAGGLFFGLAGPAQPVLAAACSVPGTHPTLQAAINDPACDPITIAAGTFNENLDISRGLTLQGAGQTATIINGGGVGRGVTIDGAGIVVYMNDLRLTNGNGTAAPNANFGGGVLVTGGAVLYGSRLQIDNNNATTGVSGFGGGIAINDGSAYLSNSLVYSNTANRRADPFTGSGRGGGLYINNGILHLTGSQVLDNLAAYRADSDESASGGGLHVNQATEVYLSGNTWQGNIARGSNSVECDLLNCVGGNNHEGGGAVGVSFTTGTALLTITNDSFIGNIANNVNTGAGNNSGRGGALSFNTTNIAGRITANLNQVTITQNIAAQKSNGSGEEGQGGAIYARHTRLAIKRAKIYNNQAAAAGQGSGGGIYKREPLEEDFLDLVNTILAGNTAAGVGRGAQIYTEYTNLEANNVTRIIHSTLADDNLNAHEALFYFSSDASDTLFITNTIVASHAIGIQNTNVTGKATARYMLFHGNTDNHPAPGAVAFPDTTGWVVGDPDPLFVNPAANDYHLGAGSPALNAGINASVIDDIDGDSRPQDGGFDIGADEYTQAGPGTEQKVYLPILLKN